MSTSRYLPVYALIIAINGDGLAAPEADAFRLRDTLITLGVLPESIEMLLGANATRSNIIQCLLNVSTHPRIVENAPILIYFAGHGTRGRLSIPRVGRRLAEYLVPFDGLQMNNRSVRSIPDITISALLGKIARSKSNHITFLLDCCHSGGGSRGGEVHEFSPQPLEGQPDFDTAAIEQEDGELWSEFLNGPDLVATEQNARAVSNDPRSFRYQGVTSHVLIASCHETEQSYEFPLRPGEPPSGVFTDSLITALHECQEDNMTWNITYPALFNRIKDIMRSSYSQYPQTPQLEGYHRNRHVFATSAFPHRHHAVAPIIHERGVYALPIGSLAGVHNGAFFEIYDYPNCRRKLVGRFPISALNEIRTNIIPERDLELGPDAYAVLCTPPIRLPVRISPEFIPYWNHPDLQAALESRLGRRYPLTQFITPAVRPEDRSKLQISISQRNEIQIQTEFGLVIAILNSRQWALFLSSALTKAIMFYHHLERASVMSNHTSQLFEVQVVELSPTLIDKLAEDEVGPASALAPRRGRDPILLRPNNETRIVANHPPDTDFGLRVLNRTNDNYFIYIFYFDPSDFSITSLYTPPSSNPIPPLLGDRDLTVGYGPQGASPLQFTIDAHLARDPGFFKLYFSHHPVDMSTIQQDGFDPGAAPRPPASQFTDSSPPYGSVLYPIAVLNSGAQFSRDSIPEM